MCSKAISPEISFVRARYTRSLRNGDSWAHEGWAAPAITRTATAIETAKRRIVCALRAGLEVFPVDPAEEEPGITARLPVPLRDACGSHHPSSRTTPAPLTRSGPSDRQ